MNETAPLLCPACGRELDERDLHLRYRLPDEALTVPEDQRSGWSEFGDFLITDTLGVFVRVMLPVNLSDGYKITYGTWLNFGDKESYEHAWRVWRESEYRSLVIHGLLSNAIQPWGDSVIAVARASVRDAEQVPYIDELISPSAPDLLNTVWDRAWVLAAVPATVLHRH